METQNEENKMSGQKKKIITRFLIAAFVTLAFLYCVATFAEAGQVVIDLSDADTTYKGTSSSSYSGISVSPAGDIDGDTYDDFLVGAYGYSGSTGAAYLIYGTESLTSEVWLNDTSITRFDGKSTNDWTGRGVSGGGNFNGDAYPDILVGAPLRGSSGVDKAEAYLVLGSASLATTTTFDLNNADATYTSINSDDRLGWSLSLAGDVNDDNLDDAIISAYNRNSYTGEMYVIYGTNSPSDKSVSNADVTITGEGTQDWAGWSVSNAGDVNGDNIDDILIGAFKQGATDKGKAYLIYGNANLNSTYDLSTNADVTYTAEFADGVGSSVAIVKDVNGDNVDDILIGASEAHPGGEAYLIFGSDSLSDIVLSTANVNVTMTAIASGDGVGRSVSSAGDINNDGFNDILIGSYGSNDYAGQAYIVFGRETSSWPSTIDLGTTQGEFNVNILDGINADDYAGYAVAGAGDFNKDNYADVIVGAYGADPGSYVSGGETYFLSGESILIAQPEPATMVLFGVGLAGLGYRVRRSRGGGGKLKRKRK